MMIFKTLSPLLVFLFAALTLPKKSLQEARRSVASINVTIGQVGEPLTLRCEAPSLKVDDKRLEISFHTAFSKLTATSFLADITIENPTKSHASTHFDSYSSSSAPFYRQYISSVTLLPATSLTSYEVSIIPKAEFSAEFYCNAYYANEDPVASNRVPLTVAGKEIEIQRSVLQPRQLPPTSKLLLFTGKRDFSREEDHFSTPFIVTCSLSRLQTSDFNNGKGYTVRFYSSLEGLLARYQLDDSGNSFLITEEYDHVSAHLGPRSSYPDFDLVITEKETEIQGRQSYWCELVESATHRYESPHWPLPPFVEFRTPSLSSSTSTAYHRSERHARCTVVEFPQHTTLEYEVQFYSSLGPKADENLLGYYVVRPGKTTEFVAEHHFPFTSTVNGASVFYPDFDIITRLNGTSSGNDNNSNKWWCALRIGQQGQDDYRLIRSNLKTL